jgi:hypothetical protein
VAPKPLNLMMFEMDDVRNDDCTVAPKPLDFDSVLIGDCCIAPNPLDFVELELDSVG